MFDFGFAYRGLHYLLFSRHRKGHGVHSPFVYRLIREVFLDKRIHKHFNKVESIRRKMLHDQHQVNITGFGAGSRLLIGRQRRISEIVTAGSVKPKYGKLLYNLAVWMDPDVIVELGTSVGMGSLYLAGGAPGKPIYSVEGEEVLAAIAMKNLELAGFQHVTVIQGSFESGLVQILPELRGNLLIFMDGDHRKEPTLHYFRLLLEKITPESVIIIDDIHWSSEMEETWEILCQCAEVKVSIDIFHMGILFFKQGLQKENYRIKF
jgi:predicted O-methyltransferase YrrM